MRCDGCTIVEGYSAERTLDKPTCFSPVESLGSLAIMTTLVHALADVEPDSTDPDATDSDSRAIAAGLVPRVGGRSVAVDDLAVARSAVALAVATTLAPSPWTRRL